MEDDFPNEKPVKNKARPSLRDYFAAHAMQGYCTRGGHYEDPEKDKYREWSWALDSYIMADAMLKARQVKLVYEPEPEQKATE